MVMYYHETECHIEFYLQGQGHSESLYHDQNMTVLAISTILLICLLPYLV